MFRTHLVIVALLLAVSCLCPAAQAGKGGNGGGKPGGGGGGGGGGGDAAGPMEIAFAKARKRGGFDLAVTDAAGSKITTLVSSASSSWLEADWSPDGTQIAFYGTLEGPGIYVVGADGSNLQKIASTTAGYTTNVSWSPTAAPDGRSLILFDDDGGNGGMYGNADLFVVEPDGSGRTRITFSSSRSETSPVWSRDAASIATVVAYHSPGMPNDVVVVELEVVTGALVTGDETNVTDVAAGPLRTTAIYHVDWARTADVLAVAAVPPNGTDADLWILDLAAPASAWNLTSTSGTEERGPSWSSDDAAIAFWTPGGKQKVLTLNADGQSAPTTVASGGMSPAWRR